MSRLICLANSRKHNGRCIAGIDISTGDWVRPVTSLDDGRIPTDISLIDRKPIQLLDVVDIPLSKMVQGYECENRLILDGSWKRVGRVATNDVIPYCENKILHTHRDDWINAIPHSYISSLPADKRRTLQIIKVSGFQTWRNNYGKWKGSIPLKSGQDLVLNVTDPELCNKLDNDYAVNSECLVVLSLAQPWKKPSSEGELQCYRLIAGVLEL